MIRVLPWSDLDGHAVLTRLDPMDLLEAQLARGGAALDGITLFADWRAMQPLCLESHLVADRAGRPFMALALTVTGARGVASAALLARDHRRFRRPLAEAAAQIRDRLFETAARHGLHRIEARCWAGHPGASHLLGLLGFRLEAAMPGFGPQGRATFKQYAWLAADPAHDWQRFASPTGPRAHAGD